MDKEHRHELKENDLEQFLANFGEWRKKYGTTALLWILLVALIVVGWNLYGSLGQARHDNAWNDLAGTTGPDSYPFVADESDVKAVKILASLYGGDARLEQALKDKAEGGDEEELGTVTFSDRLDQAEQMYQQTLTLTDEPIFQANAYLGLASVAESRHDFEKAGEYYDDVIAAADPKYPALVEQANRRKLLLARLDEPVVFGTESVLDQPNEPATEDVATDDTASESNEAAPSESTETPPSTE